MMEAMLEHPERRLAEIAREMLRVFGRHFHVSIICLYSERNGVTRKTIKLRSISRATLGQFETGFLFLLAKKSCTTTK